jgi:hypothetical protein
MQQEFFVSCFGRLAMLLLSPFLAFLSHFVGFFLFVGQVLPFLFLLISLSQFAFLLLPPRHRAIRRGSNKLKT